MKLPAPPPLARLFLLAAATFTGVACAAAPDGDLPFDEAGLAGAGKADGVGLSFSELFAPVDPDRLVPGGKAILTSAAAWEAYLGSAAPADVDFSSEWVAFYGAGAHPTGGFAAEVVGLELVPELGALVLETRFQSPGFDCFVTMAPTWPHTLIRFDIPEPRPTFAVSRHDDHTYRCGPTNEERLAALADSRVLWEAAKKKSGDSYRYRRDFASFFGFSFHTELVVEAGVVVERHYHQPAFAGMDEVSFSEIGAEVGTHAEGHAPLLLDDLYAECAGEVLVQDEEENFIHLGFDEAGLLQACTYFPKACADDCSRGPTITEIRF